MSSRWQSMVVVDNSVRTKFNHSGWKNLPIQIVDVTAQMEYSWKRFWCTRETGFSLADNGFLYDPESTYGKTINPYLLSLQDLSEKPCLALLGEPGIGKSHEIRTLQEMETHRHGQDNVLFLDLRAYQTDSRLCSALFENEKFQRWIAGTHRLHLFLDSLDECLLRIQTVTSLLEEELCKCPVDRLSFRVACRTAEWPHSLEAVLGRLYGQKDVQVSELVPLRRADVETAASCEGIPEPSQFIETLIEHNAVPLAIKPVTLTMLVNIFLKENAFPSKQIDLYRKGCLLMCEEPDARRRESTKTGGFPAADLYATASRIAAVTIFGNRYAIWMDINRGDMPPEDVAVSELCGGTETADGRQVEVTEALVRAAMGTGLFTSRGPHRMGWAHQTYAEFLAASYLFQTSMTKKQIMSLLVHPSDTQQRLIPQLYETAAWSANMNEDIFAAIMEHEAEILLRSDVAAFEPEDRRRLVDSLLVLFDAERLLDRDTYQSYHKLNSPSLTGQLTPYITNRDKGFLVRRVAIDIAEACECRELLPSLTEVALSPEDNLSVRENAACAIARIGDPDSRGRLRPLVFGEVGEDPEDQLKGWALSACWPGHMSNQELFQVLEPGKSPNLFGSYDMFLSDLPDKLTTALQGNDLKYALQWVADVQGLDWHFKSHWQEIRDWIIQESWENLLEFPELVEPFAKVVFASTKRHEHLVSQTKESEFNKVLGQDVERRRLITKTIVPMFAGQAAKLYLLIAVSPFVTEDDLKWMLNEYDNSSAEEAKLWGELVGLFHHQAFPWNFKSLIALRCCRPVLANCLGYLLRPFSILYSAYIGIRAFYWRRKFLLRRNRKRPPLKPPPKQRVLVLLDKFEHGNPDAWWWLHKEMTLEADSTHYGDELESDITQLPVWQELDEKTHARLLDATRKYVLHPPALDRSWIGTNNFDRKFMAAYRALVLLLDKDSEFFWQLPDSVWKTWAPIFVAYPLYTGVGEEPHTVLTKQAYQKAAYEVIQTLMAIIDKENDQGHIFVIRRVEPCWDQRLAKALFEKAKSEEMKPACRGDLFDTLFQRDYQPAIEYAKTQLAAPIPDEESELENVLVLAESLLANQPGTGWRTIKPLITADADFGKRVFARSASLYRHDRIGLFAQRLNETQIAEMYIWLARHYPHNEDPRHEGAHAVGVRETIADFRDSLLGHLKTRGTPGSGQELQRIASELPELTWMKWTILDAERNTRSKTWTPLKVEEIIRLGENRHNRYVGSGRQLIDLLLESLERLQQKLRTESSALRSVWDNRGDSHCPSWCPVDEPALSDYIAQHLRDDLGPTRGVVINREVQIRRGLQTDIHVDAVLPPEGDGPIQVIQVVIEVKGCWHPELETAMKSQLTDRYLQKSRCPYGLYLVGWFLCDKWSDEDHRKCSVPGYTAVESQKHFSEQAVEVASKSDIPNLILEAFVLDASFA